MSNIDNTLPAMFDRAYAGSLYNCGYEDGYTARGYNPRWCPYLLNRDEIAYTINRDEIEEYDIGYKEGKFHFVIDKKQ